MLCRGRREPPGAAPAAPTSPAESPPAFAAGVTAAVRPKKSPGTDGFNDRRITQPQSGFIVCMPHAALSGD